MNYFSLQWLFLIMKTWDCLEAPGQELVLHLQVVALVDLRLEGLIQDGVARVVLDVLPASVAVSEVDSRSTESNGIFAFPLPVYKYLVFCPRPPSPGLSHYITVPDAYVLVHC